MEILPVHTLIRNENKNGCLLLCGLNHGYSKLDEELDNSGVDRSDPYKSFFSDKSVNDYPFRNNIVKWFKLWGYTLESNKESAGLFEYSIVQTNWSQSCSHDTDHCDLSYFIKDSSDFINTCEHLKPKLIFLFGKDIFEAFVSPELSEEIEGIFGKRLHLECKQKDVENVTKFKFHFLSYENASIVALPHATGARGLSDDYIKAFQPEMKEVIDLWWNNHKKKFPV